MTAVLGFLADAVVVVIFAAIGRRSHAESDALTGVAVTAWPFLAGVVLGWAGSLAVRRRWPAGVRDGVPVWVAAVVVGMVLRHLTGRGTAPSFVVVATVFLGLFLLGWRAIRAVVARAR
jgi:hypothetical protein